MPIRPGDTPVPIPNTMVKTGAADGTMLETVWKSRRVPDFLKNLLVSTSDLKPDIKGSGFK